MLADLRSAILHVWETRWCEQAGNSDVEGDRARGLRDAPSLFDQPAFLGWGGTGRRSDAEVRRKYLDRVTPAVKCLLVVLAGHAVVLAQLQVADDGEGGEGGGRTSSWFRRFAGEVSAERSLRRWCAEPMTSADGPGWRSIRT